MTKTRTGLLVLLFALMTTAACGSDNGDSVAERVLAAEPQADETDVAVDVDYIRSQVPDASDEQVAEWIIEVIRWNRCLEENPTGDGCEPLSSDNPRSW
jgi:hypothetical protein